MCEVWPRHFYFKQINIQHTEHPTNSFFPPTVWFCDSSESLKCSFVTSAEIINCLMPCHNPSLSYSVYVRSQLIRKKSQPQKPAARLQFKPGHSPNKQLSCLQRDITVWIFCFGMDWPWLTKYTQRDCLEENIGKYISVFDILNPILYFSPQFSHSIFSKNKHHIESPPLNRPIHFLCCKTAEEPICGLIKGPIL